MPTNAQIGAVIADIGPQYVADAVTRNVELWELIQKMDASDPKGPRWEVKTAGNASAGQYTPGGTLPSAGSAEFDQAKMNWGNFLAIVEFNTRQITQINAANRNPATVLVDQILEQLKDQAKAIIAAMNAGLISGADAVDGLIGICTAIDDAGTYAGLDRGAVTEFACYVAANGGTPRTLTVAILDTVYDYAVNTVKLDAGNWVLMTGTAQASTMRGFSTGNIAPYVAAPVVNGLVPGGVPKILSHAKLQYRDMPILVVPGYTAGRVDFCNLDDLAVECLNGKDTPFVMGVPGSNELFQVVGDLVRFILYCWCQLRFRNPRHNAFSIQDLS
jgi:hypothetical protein